MTINMNDGDYNCCGFSYYLFVSYIPLLSTEPPVRFMRPRKMASVVERFAGEAMVLDCEVSRANAEVTWKRNGEEVEDSRKVTILEDVVLRQLTVHCLSLEDAGQYICDAKDDVMDFQVKVKGIQSHSLIHAFSHYVIITLIHSFNFLFLHSFHPLFT